MLSTRAKRRGAWRRAPPLARPRSAGGLLAALFGPLGEEGDWARPFDPSARWPPGINAVLPGNAEFDRRIAPRSLRILTVNMHGRPLDVSAATRHALDLGVGRIPRSGTATGAAGAGKGGAGKEGAGKEGEGKGGASFLAGDAGAHGDHAACDDEWALSNAQDRRMRAFFEWLDALGPEVYPHVLCFQEIMWTRMIDIAVPELAKRGFVSHPSIALENDRGRRDTWPPRMGSGLGVYVRRDQGLQVVAGGRVVFDGRLGADVLVDKGFKWALVRCRARALLAHLARPAAPSAARPAGPAGPAGPESRAEERAAAARGEVYFLVATCHPQAYNQLYAEPAPGEPGTVAVLRRLVRLGFDLQGGFPDAIVSAHEAQFAQLATSLEEVVAALPPAQKPLRLFVGADFNVNRYAAAPESAQEGDPATAWTPRVSREFAAVCAALAAVPPRLLREPDVFSRRQPRLATPHGGRFTWDASGNSLAEPLVPGQPRSFALIDGVLASSLGGLRQPAYIDNRAIAMRLARPVPELSPFWSRSCFVWRRARRGARSSYDPVNRVIAERLALGRAQRSALKRAWRAGRPPDEKEPAPGEAAGSGRAWEAFVLAAPYEASSQLWKGLEFYGYRWADLNALRVPLRVGDPHPFRMIEDVTDHHALLARVIL
jgi:hypothetical protein